MSSSLRGIAAIPRTIARRPRAVCTFATEAAAEPPAQPRRRNTYAAHKDPTGPEASEYLTSLLSLPPSVFPPSLALQILTHKSFRFVHRVSHPPPYTAQEISQSQASHNARLAFMGRRAIAAYTAMFIHSSVPNLYAVDFLRGRSLDQKLDALRHQLNLGHQVGDAWKIADFMRWDRNDVGHESGHAKVKGQAVEAVIGGVFTQLGSVEAQRAFFIHVLPLLAPQLRDPSLVEAAMKARDQAKVAGAQ